MRMETRREDDVYWRRRSWKVRCVQGTVETMRKQGENEDVEKQKHEEDDASETERTRKCSRW